MRDIFLVLAVAISLGFTLRFPFVGILVWEWFTLGNPHQETFGFAHTLPLNLVVAGAAVLSWLVSDEPKKIPRSSITTLFFLFLVWMTFNSFFAFDPGWSWPYWDRTWRVFALGFLIAATANNRVRINAVIWIAAISLMYYGVKGGIFTVVKGGGNKVFGPAGTIITDNNQLALALLMTLPLIEYLRTNVSSKTMSLILTGSLVSTALAVLGSYSRGAYIAMAALAVFFLLHTKRRFLYLFACAAVIVPAIYFMPQSFFDRVDTMNSLDTDNSFQGRVMAWQVAFHYAVDHFPFGAGFYGPQLDGIFLKYFPGTNPHAAHSIYFQVLGEHGFIGFALYLGILLAAFKYSISIIRRSKNSPDAAWAQKLGRMIQVSLIAFGVGGAALSMAYYDLFVILVFLLPNIAAVTTQYVPRAAGSKWRAGPRVTGPLAQGKVGAWEPT